jgi:serine protease AprX
VAGLIAGNGASSNGQYPGEAPGARLVSIKVAGLNGTTHLSTLITGLQWAVDHQAVYGIRVLNLSLGYQSSQSTVTNPLDQAVQAVWNSGITVVTSAGNAGPFDGTILSPGDDPLAITVGALDDMATPSTADDEMNDFSSVGPTTRDGWAKPDLVTSGRSVVSLAAPGSTIANQYPSARVGSGNFVGSGTSFSTAIASGAAALVLADNPGITPNEVKARLLGTTNPGPVGNPFVDGHGALDAYAAATAGPMDYHQSAAGLIGALLGATVSLSPSGSADTWNLNLWSGLSVSQGSGGGNWNGLSWSGADWNGWAWTGRTWNDGGWSGAAWNGEDWTGRSWNGGGWSGSAWNGAAWTGAAWDSSAWK